MPSLWRTSLTSPTSGWKNGAWKKAKFLLAKFSRCFASDFSLFTPKISSTSELPDLLETALLPCFATFIPRLARINATVVEIFIVLKPSPPVPQRSIIGVSSR